MWIMYHPKNIMFNGEMAHMRDLSWNYFSKTGDVDAYLLYKQVSEEQPGDSITDEEEQAFEDPLGGLNG